MDNIKKDEAQDQKPDELAESLNDLFSSVATMIKSELQVKLPILSPILSNILRLTNSTYTWWFEMYNCLENHFWRLSTYFVIICNGCVCQGTNNHLELLEKINLRVAEEYNGFGDLASGLRMFVEQLKCKSGSFNEYVEQIDAIEKQVTEFEAVVSMLDKYVALLESRVQSQYQTKNPPSWLTK